MDHTARLAPFTTVEILLAGVLLAPKPPVKPVVEVTIVPVTDGPVVEVALEPTGAEVFGAPVPGRRVVPRPTLDLFADYTPKGRWGRRLDGKPVRLGGLQGPPKKAE